MLLKSARITRFKSIEDSGLVLIDSEITVLVGQNESGKTAFLKALHKAEPIEGKDKINYDATPDYPRINLNTYEKSVKSGEAEPALVTVLTYQLEQVEIDKINSDLGYDLLEDLTFSVSHSYENTETISINIIEVNFIKHLLDTSNLPIEIIKEVSEIKTLRALIEKLGSLDLNKVSSDFFDNIKNKFNPTEKSWDNLLEYHIWKNFLSKNIPKFLYFDDYKLLPGRINLLSLSKRIEQDKTDEKDETVLALLQLADIDIEDLLASSGYENYRARLEATSNSITDMIFKFWTQNKELEVEFDIKEDKQAEPPFNEGANLYIRIKNTRHRVSLPFDQRSKGFVWFFSFLVWFDDIQHNIANNKSKLILLLDEPGLSLHGLAQADFIRYIEGLANKHQVIYTTHSPFMVQGEKLHQVRTVEDRLQKGTQITDNISSSNSETLFPLQAALGYTIAQNLFISRRNLLVEGIADLAYLQFFSNLLEQKSLNSLRSDVTIVPVGGLDKVATFVALFGANKLDIVVLHDFKKNQVVNLEDLVKEKIIKDNYILNYAMFREEKTNPTKGGLISTDIEDLFTPSLYIKLFNSAFHGDLKDNEIQENKLPPGERIIDRIDRYLKSCDIKLRQTGGYNHYQVAKYLVSTFALIEDIDNDTLDNFNRLFKKINSLYK